MSLGQEMRSNTVWSSSWVVRRSTRRWPRSVCWGTRGRWWGRPLGSEPPLPESNRSNRCTASPPSKREPRNARTYGRRRNHTDKVAPKKHILLYIQALFSQFFLHEFGFSIDRLLKKIRSWDRSSCVMIKVGISAPIFKTVNRNPVLIKSELKNLSDWFVVSLAILMLLLAAMTY